MITRGTCPTCGGNVAVHHGREGTSHMVPANTAEQTAGALALEAIREHRDGWVKHNGTQAGNARPADLELWRVVGGIEG